MVLAYHAIFGAYWFWLPNDPRGSWSDFVGSWELVRFGKATKTNSRVSVAGVTHDFHLRTEAKRALKHPPVQFSGRQALWPLHEPPVWAKGCWKVFLDTPAGVTRAIDYVNANPERDGKPPQRWSVVTPSPF